MNKIQLINIKNKLLKIKEQYPKYLTILEREELLKSGSNTIPYPHMVEKKQNYIVRARNIHESKHR